MPCAAPSLRPRQRDQVQRVAGRYACLSVTRLPGDDYVIGVPESPVECRAVDLDTSVRP